MLRSWAGALAWSWCLLVSAPVLRAQASANAPANLPAGASQVLAVEGRVEFAKAGNAAWQGAQASQVLMPGDRLRTAAKSRATLRLSNKSVLRVNESTTLTIQAPGGSNRPLLDLGGGSVFMLDRDNPSSMDFRTKLASGAVRGTEFLLSAEADGRTTVAVLEGAVEVSSEQGKAELGPGEQAVIETGKGPVKSAVANAVNLVQWALYYPGVLDADELGLGGEAVLAESLAAYRAGDLLTALAKYPADRAAGGDAERAYHAGLLLAVGQVVQAEAELEPLAKNSPPATTLRSVIAAVKGQPREAMGQAATAGEELGNSYYQQSQLNLVAALSTAKAAVAKAPGFGFAHARVAELEFSFGRTDAAWAALEKALQLSPRNAQAHALKGFLLAAKGRITEAQQSFEAAMAIDPALGSAWLGRGLARIRLGHADAGRQDLQTAAVVEPHRSLDRSYLGKAFSHAGDDAAAARELAQAHKLDPKDPTPLLYRSLLNRQRNRVNEAVSDLEESVRLNDNRGVYRSRFLLDQDRSVRGANLAAVYQDAGLFDVGLREAARAVNDDYANYSAHLFLANAYDSLRDPRGASLRYETPWLSEYLLANLLAPPGAGLMSGQISQQEYTRFFERDRFGLSSQTEYWSRGDWAQGGAVFGNVDGTAFNLESYYRSEKGQVANAGLENLTVSLQLKQQVTPKDALYFQAVIFDGEAGDTTQYYEPTRAIPGYRQKEKQEPLVLAGWHHEWNPGSHTLVLFSRLEDELNLFNPAQQSLVVDKFFFGAPTPFTIAQNYRSELEIYSAEVQQIFQAERHRVILGARYQNGDFDSSSRHSAPSLAPALFAPVPSAQQITSDFERITAYSYLHWRLLEPLWLVGGVSYDELLHPLNLQVSPLNGQQDRARQVSPKAGLIWTPCAATTVRFGYAQYLGGVSFDQSFQLEPSQIAGFNQSLRGVIPESLSGSTAGGRSEVWGLSLEQKLHTRTYLGVSAEMLRSGVDRSVGVYDLVGLPVLAPLVASSTPERLDYRERSVTATINQLCGEYLSFGARYRFSNVELNDRFPALPASFNNRATLQQLTLNAAFTHRCGFFTRFETEWFKQGNLGYVTPTEPNGRPGDDFWQLNYYAGYRFKRRAAEVLVGVLNLADHDYRLNPLSLHADLPRERTVYASFKFHF